MQVVFGLIAAVLGLVLAAVVLTMVLVPIFKGIGWLVSHLFTFIGGEIKDTLRVVGAVITGVIFSLLVVANILIFRWSAAAHFGRAFSAEIGAGAASIYRILIGHPARLLGLNSLVDGIENRVPQAVAAAPTRDKPSRRTGLFEGYRIIGSLAGGGSGGKLYIAEPDDVKLASFTRNGQEGVEQVVIKTFSLRDGSSLPQIVRESRSLDAAKRLGLVLDHELTPERFFYVMRYVPGESLGLVTQHLHAASPPSGLSNAHLAKTLGYTEHLLSTLQRYHEGGLWHKDVKPDNIIVHGAGAHLVDFGLITPLRSAMTLTTHGTEYFRDPEMVRMALKGVKVHEVDGAKFDVYAAGAVLYSVIENSFPAHGGLSQISKRCPDALRWIIRRAMADYDKRYVSASAMLADLRFVSRAADPFAVKPAALPSFTGAADGNEPPVVEVSQDEFEFVPPKPLTPPAPEEPAPARPVSHAGPVAATAVAPSAAKPKLRVTNWWSGRYELDDGVPSKDQGGAAVFVCAVDIGKGSARRAARARASAGSGAVRRPAAEQLRAARGRAEERRARAQDRMGRHRRDLRTGRRHASGVNAGVVASIFLFLLFCAAIAGVVLVSEESRSYVQVEPQSENVFEPGHGVRVQTGREVDRGSGSLASASAAVLPELSGRVLVISDLGLPLDPQVDSTLRSIFTTMQQTGLEVLGTFEWLALDDAATSLTTELSAQVQRAIQFTPLDSPDAKSRLSEWLSGDENADLLVWIEGGDEPGAQPRMRFFASPDVQGKLPEGYLSSLERMLAENT